MDIFSAAAFHRPFELLIKRGIDRSTTAQAMARALEGRTFDLRVDGTLMAFRLEATGGLIRVGMPGSTPADATLAGPPLAVARLLGGNAQALIRDGDLRMTGNADVATQFQELLRMARPDLEEELSKVVGDPAAGELGQFVRNIAAWGGRATDSVARSVGEYLQEERRSVVTRSELQEFCAAVDDTANGVERAEARLAILRGSDDRRDLPAAVPDRD